MNWERFEQAFNLRMKSEHIPGAAVAVSQNGKLIYQKGFGVKDIESMEPVTPDTIFGVASVTKSFTAFTILQLEEEGKLSVNDPVIQYLPDLAVPSIENIESIKIHHLLTHTTGLAPLKRKEELNKFHDHLSYLGSYNHDVLGKPGEYFSYCNDTFLLLGAIIEKVTGCLFRRYVTEHVLNSLQMYRSTFSLEELHKLDNVSTPYVFDKHLQRYEKQSWPQLGNYEAGGGIRSTVLDLVKYGELYVNQGNLNGNPLLSKEQVEKMYGTYHQLDQRSYYGYALMVTPKYNGVTLVEHGGGQPGVSSNFGFIPEKNLVVAILTNVSGASAHDIWLEAVNTALEIPLDEKSNEWEIVDLSDREMENFIGTYQSNEGSCLKIILENRGLNALIEDEVFPLMASANHTFISHDKKFTVRFFFKQDRKAWAAFFGMRMLLRAD